MKYNKEKDPDQSGIRADCVKRAFDNAFFDGMQHDAQEFLGAMLDRLPFIKKPPLYEDVEKAIMAMKEIIST